MKPIIKVENLSKHYKLGDKRRPYSTLRESLVETAQKPLNFFRQGQRKKTNEFWALRDVSFEVSPGEVVGIIGRNGAGKSTLLKIVSRITEPTSGRIELYGRVGSLLEVGTGFHPELTGRENIFLNGAILGMRREEIERKFDEIVDFAEIDSFLDTPVKYYSSGMYTRLAFAVAANLEPEIFIVDEVLAVGDINFQKKCLGKMSEVAKGGRTVLFVSHNMAAVKSLCSRAIMLKKGKISISGNTEDVINHYLHEDDREGSMLSSYVWDEGDVIAENSPARLIAVKILDRNKNAVSQSSISSPFDLEIEYEVLKMGSKLSLAIVIHSQEGVHVLSSPSMSDSKWYQQPHPKGRFRGYCNIPSDLLNHGRFDFSVLLVENGTSIVAEGDKVISLDLIDLGEKNINYYGNWGGVVRPFLAWKTELLSD